MTTWALAALRAGRLDKPARQLHGGHLAAANSFYCGAMYEFYSRCVTDYSRCKLLNAERQELRSAEQTEVSMIEQSLCVACWQGMQGLSPGCASHCAWLVLQNGAG